MNKALYYKVQTIAEEVRDWVQELAGKRGHIEGFDLNGFCAIASAELHKRLIKAEVAAELHLATCIDGSHVYVVCEDHIIDVTATQFYEFRRVPVMIAHYKEVQHLWFYQSEHIFLDYRKLRKAQISWGWPQDQVAFAR